MLAARRVWSLLGLLLVPLVVAAGFLWATWDFDTRLERVEAAVVNLDEPVTIDGRLVPLGRQLAGGLVEGPDEENFRWTLTDGSDAAAGLAAGRYAAVVTIPAHFSAQATSFRGNDPDRAERATIEVQTSEVSGIADPVVGRAITAAATRALSTSLTEEYLENVYLGFNRLSGQFGTLTDGADQLAGGTADLSGGLRRSTTGGQELAAGLDRLDQGADRLAVGAGQLSTGAGRLASGLSQLSRGLTRSARGAEDLADGADDLTGGAGRLARGADDLARGIGDLRTGTASRPGGTRAYAAGAAEFSAGLGRYSDQLAGYAGQTDAQLAQIVPCPAELPPPSCPVFYAGLRAGTAVGVQGLADRGDRPGLLSGAKDIAAGAAGIDAGVGRLQSGATAYAAGVGRFATGTRELATGADQLAGGLDGLAIGSRRSAAGARDLASGAGRLGAGVADLSAGAGASAEGAEQLGNGLIRLSDSGDRLAAATEKLALGLAEGRREVPTYTPTEQDRLSGVVSTPVSAPAVDGASYSDIASTTLLVVLALWLGGLAAYVVLRPVTNRVLISMRPSWTLALAGLAPAAVIAVVQAVVLSFVLHRLLDLSAGQTAALVPYAMLIGLTFVAVNHALVAWLGGAGRFISVVVVVVAVAGGLTSAVPGFFDALVPYLPLTQALQGLRTVVSEGDGAVSAAGLLLGWLLLAVSASVLAVTRRRMLPADLGESAITLTT